MATTDEAKDRLRQQATGTSVEHVKPERELLTRLNDAIRARLPQHVGADRFDRIALTLLQRNPDLMACDPLSLMGAIVTAAEVGLEPGTHDGHCYILPFREKGGRKKATFILGYKGLVELALRSGKVTSIIARPVYQGEHFTFREETDRTVLTHEPDLDGAPTTDDLRGAYAVARLELGPPIVAYLSRRRIDEFRARSKAPDSPAWRDDYVAMALKTVARRLEPWLPKSPELRRAVEADEQVAVYRGADAVEVMHDGLGVDVGPIERDDSSGSEALGPEGLKGGSSDPEGTTPHESGENASPPVGKGQPSAEPEGGTGEGGTSTPPSPDNDGWDVPRPADRPDGYDVLAHCEQAGVKWAAVVGQVIADWPSNSQFDRPRPTKKALVELVGQRPEMADVVRSIVDDLAGRKAS